MIQKNNVSLYDIERMKAEFYARGGQVTKCPTRNLGSKMLRKNAPAEKLAA